MVRGTLRDKKDRKRGMTKEWTRRGSIFHLSAHHLFLLSWPCANVLKDLKGSLLVNQGGKHLQTQTLVTVYWKRNRKEWMDQERFKICFVEWSRLISKDIWEICVHLDQLLNMWQCIVLGVFKCQRGQLLLIGAVHCESHYHSCALLTLICTLICGFHKASSMSDCPNCVLDIILWFHTDPWPWTLPLLVR